MRLNDNVFVDGRQYPKGCLPPVSVADRIGAHAWEEGDPTVACPVFDDGVAEALDPTTTGAALPAAPVVDPVASDGALMGDIDDEPDGALVDEPDDEMPDVSVPEGPVDRDGSLEPAAVPLPPVPARAGRGAKRELWAVYAAALGLTTTEDQSRDDIIAMVDAHVALSAVDVQA